MKKDYKTIGVGQINILNRPEDAVERYGLFIETLRKKPMDIVCVQEMTHPEELAEMMRDLGYLYHVKTQMFVNRYGVWDCLGMFSRTPLEEIQFINPHERSLIGATTVIDERQYNVFSVHLSWGPGNLFNRLRQVSLVDRIAETYEKNNSGSVSIVAGDFNADAESRPIRFLKGWDVADDGHSSTLWMDAYNEAGSHSNWVTSDHSVNNYGKMSALRNGVLDTDFIPRRRIDYIFSRGWLYGKNGYPVEFGYLEDEQGREISDHNGIYAKLLVL